MDNYKYVVENGIVAECESCGWPAPLSEFRRRAKIGQVKKICEVCAKTEVGTVTDYMKNDDIGIYRAIGQATNLLLDKLTGRSAKMAG